VPRRLLERCQPDSIREFRAAARQRFDDGLVLSAAGKRTAAIYLWGYAAEMILKAAYFSAVGLGDVDGITWNAHLLPAIHHGRVAVGIQWPHQGQGHNVRAWAELLIATRASTAGKAYPPSFGTGVLTHGQRIEQVWSETLRYHKNYAYPHEVRRVREAAEWYLSNSYLL